MPTHTNTNNLDLPILYSFRRCPYAMRARLAIAASGLTVELREVVLRNKPEALLKISPKATVPVCLLPNNTVIDESVNIMKWALGEHDPFNWLLLKKTEDRETVDNINLTAELIQINDGAFKQALDRYKYADRHPEATPEEHRQKAEPFLRELEGLLKENNKHVFDMEHTKTSADHDLNTISLMTDHYTFADIAILPFVRQYAHVDKAWFFDSDSPYPCIQLWLTAFLESTLFTSIMTKYKPWQASTHDNDIPAVIFGSNHA